MRIYHTLGILSVFILTSCDSMQSKTDYYESDEYVISEIQKATNKIEVEYSELPEDAINTIETLYNSNISISELYAPDLGYEVVFNDIDSDESLFKEVYFNLEGRKLESKDNKEDCIDLVFPVTFIMPDGSVIIVEGNSEEDWLELKSWYDNSDSKDWPEIQYPVEIILENGEISLINDNEEMEVAKLSCE